MQIISYPNCTPTLAEHCQFGGLRDELVRDRIVVGLKDTTLQTGFRANLGDGSDIRPLMRGS